MHTALVVLAALPPAGDIAGAAPKSSQKLLIPLDSSVLSTNFIQHNARTPTVGSGGIG